MVLESQESVYFVSGEGVVISAPMLWPSNWNCTPPTAQSSAAVAVRLTTPASVVLPTIPGENIETTGGAMSGNKLRGSAPHPATGAVQEARPPLPGLKGEDRRPAKGRRSRP